MDIDYIPTKDLVEALLRREGVTVKEIGPYAPYKVEGEGPVVILIVEDQDRRLYGQEFLMQAAWYLPQDGADSGYYPDWQNALQRVHVA